MGSLVGDFLGFDDSPPPMPSARQSLVPFQSRGLSAGFGGGTRASKSGSVFADTLGLIAKGGGGKGPLQITPSNELIGLTGGIRKEGARLADAIGALKEQVTPGFGRLTSAARQTVENRRRKAIGDLRDNLARRRIGGSSFAMDRLGAIETEFLQEQNKMEAEAFLRELGLKTELEKLQSTAQLDSMKTVLNQLNFESQIGAQLSTGAQNAMMQMHQINTNFAAGSQAGIGNLIGTGLGLGGLGLMSHLNLI